MRSADRSRRRTPTGTAATRPATRPSPTASAPAAPGPRPTAALSPRTEQELCGAGRTGPHHHHPRWLAACWEP